MTGSVPQIPGQKADPDLAHHFQREVASLLGRERNVNFPGAQPVSFAMRHIKSLQEEE